MSNEYSVKVKGVGVLDFELITIEKFIGDGELVDRLEKFMGNTSGFDDEYVYMDEDYSPLIEIGKDTDHMIPIHNFIDPTSRDFCGKVEGIEISTCKVNIPKGNDVSTFNAIETNASGTYMLLFSQDDIADVTKGMFEATISDIKKLENKKSSSKSSKVIEEIEEEDLNDLDEDDKISLEDLDEDVDEEDLDDLYSGR